ncbi:hypothetical protein Taro_020769 [Colocasia esculenta]|uniref:Uncharacterized protein n=1 Tax=Colocasia esculenta TaxID=4460 RepID=A0A843V675_COLES|nr:hypothetical protein [Colocasia esculenta]
MYTFSTAQRPRWVSFQAQANKSREHRRKPGADLAFHVLLDVRMLCFRLRPDEAPPRTSLSGTLIAAFFFLPPWASGLISLRDSEEACFWSWTPARLCGIRISKTLPCDSSFPFLVFAAERGMDRCGMWAAFTSHGAYVKRNGFSAARFAIKFPTTGDVAQSVQFGKEVSTYGIEVDGSQFSFRGSAAIWAIQWLIFSILFLSDSLNLEMSDFRLTGCVRTGKLVLLAIMVSAGIVLQFLVRNQTKINLPYETPSPILTLNCAPAAVLMYVLLPMPLMFFSGSDASSLTSAERSGSWADFTKFLTGASAVGSIAIPSILKHADVIGWGALAMALSSFFSFLLAIVLFLQLSNESDYSLF